MAKKDRQVFHTKGGRIVRDGGGIEADYKIPAPKASALEITLLRSDVMNEFAALWSRKYELTNNFAVTDDMYREFQDFVEAKRKAGDIKLESLYSGALEDLKRALKQSGYKGSEREVEQLQSLIVKEIKSDFEKYKKDIKEDIATAILGTFFGCCSLSVVFALGLPFVVVLCPYPPSSPALPEILIPQLKSARYVPESFILERGLKTDTQVLEAAKILASEKKFDKVLGKTSDASSGSSSMELASSSLPDGKNSQAAFKMSF